MFLDPIFKGTLQKTLSAMVILSSLSACNASDDLKPIKFAALLPMTGLLEDGGPAFRDAITLAVEQINASGGVTGGRQLEFDLYDSKTDPGFAAELGKELLRDPEIVALVGSATSTESGLMLETAADVEKPIISCCSTANVLSDKDDWFFRTTPDDALQAKAIAKILQEGRIENGNELLKSCDEVALVAQNGDYGDGLVESIRGIIGPSNFTDQRYESDGFNATAADELVARIRGDFDALPAPSQAATTCVVLISFAPDGLKIANQINAQFGNGIDLQLIGSDGMNLPSVIRDYSVNSRPLFITGPTHAVSEAYDRFSLAMNARFQTSRENPVGFSFNNFDATILLGLAMAAADSTEGPAIRGALKDISRGGECRAGVFFGEIAQDLVNGVDVNYAGPSGDLDFNDSGDVVGNYGLFSLNAAGDEIVEQSVIELDELVDQDVLNTLTPCGQE